jgi:hypothetical protein
MPSLAGMEVRPKWWNKAVGLHKNRPHNSIPRRSIRDLSHDAIPSRMVFYSNFFRPNYFVRQTIIKKISDFNLCSDREVCATMHVRRGDVLYHLGQARFYLPLHSYVQAAHAFINVLNVTTILLLTDSQAVIDEALACEKDCPESCRGLSWRYVLKKRWYAAEGGW